MDIWLFKGIPYLFPHQYFWVLDIDMVRQCQFMLGTKAPEVLILLSYLIQVSNPWVLGIDMIRQDAIKKAWAPKYCQALAPNP